MFRKNNCQRRDGNYPAPPGEYLSRVGPLDLGTVSAYPDPDVFSSKRAVAQGYSLHVSCVQQTGKRRVRVGSGLRFVARACPCQARLLMPSSAGLPSPANRVRSSAYCRQGCVSGASRESDPLIRNPSRYTPFAITTPTAQNDVHNPERAAEPHQSPRPTQIPLFSNLRTPPTRRATHMTLCAYTPHMRLCLISKCTQHGPSFSECSDAGGSASAQTPQVAHVSTSLPHSPSHSQALSLLCLNHSNACYSHGSDSSTSISKRTCSHRTLVRRRVGLLQASRTPQAASSAARLRPALAWRPRRELCHAAPRSLRAR